MWHAASTYKMSSIWKKNATTATEITIITQPLSACVRLNLAKRVLVVENEENTDYDELMNEYMDLFQGLGCLSLEHTKRVDKSVPPVIHPCRKVPFALQKLLKAELNRMENLKVIEKIDEPTEWVSSLVIVEKKNKKPRVYMDPRDLNRALKREHYKLPTREEIMSQFANAKYFSKLDASSRFWQLRLDNESSILCTFNSPLADTDSCDCHLALLQCQKCITKQYT